MKQSSNLGLALYDTTDLMNVTGPENSLNHNMEIIDLEINNLKQDKLDADKLTDAINTALAQAKASGEFDGADGAPGKDGVDGNDGEDYVLTNADKAEIAEIVGSATIVQAPKYVDSLEEMTDTNRLYVLRSTGHIFAYMDTTVEQEVTVTDQIIGTNDNPYQVGRLSPNGALSADVTGYVLTPYIDLTKAEYQGKTIQLHLEGNRYFSEANETYIMCGLYAPDKSVIVGRTYSCLERGGLLTPLVGSSAVINGETSTILTIPIPVIHSKEQIGYLRFCGKGTVDASNVYITYTDTQLVTNTQWVDTGTTYAPVLSAEDKQGIVDAVASMIDAQLLAVVGNGAVTV